MALPHFLLRYSFVRYHAKLNTSILLCNSKWNICCCIVLKHGWFIRFSSGYKFSQHFYSSFLLATAKMMFTDYNFAICRRRSFVVVVVVECIIYFFSTVEIDAWEMNNFNWTVVEIEWVNLKSHTSLLSWYLFNVIDNFHLLQLLLSVDVFVKWWNCSVQLKLSSYARSIVKCFGFRFQTYIFFLGIIV